MYTKFEIIYRKLKKNLERNGYININHIQVESKEKIAEIAQIFRDKRYETFRIIYMNDNLIVGTEILSTKIPLYMEKFISNKSGRIKAEITRYKIQNRMEKFKANGYYLVHNHVSDVIEVTKENKIVTKYFHNNIKGLRGHLIINSNSYV